MVEVKTEKDIVFGTGSGRELKLNVHRPAEDMGKRTAIVFFHGGGFVGGNKDSIDQRVGYYAKLGYVAIASEYRLAQEAKWPSQVNDAKAAVRWARANASSLGIEPDRIVVCGFSAGGLLALVSAGAPDNPKLEGDGGNPDVSSKVAACIAYYPASNVEQPLRGAHPLFRDSDGGGMYASARPSTYITNNWPPTVFFHGTADVTIPLEQTTKFFDSLRKKNVPVELHAIEGVPHAFDRHADLGTGAAIAADLFIDRHVINPRTYPPFQAGER